MDILVELCTLYLIVFATFLFCRAALDFVEDEPTGVYVTVSAFPVLFYNLCAALAEFAF